MSVKKTYCSIDECVYDLVISKEIDIIEAVILSDINYLERLRGYNKKNETIASELNISVPTVTRKIANLKSLGLINTIKITHGRIISTTELFKTKMIANSLKSTKKYVSHQIDDVSNQNDDSSNQIDELSNQNDDSSNQIDEDNNKIPYRNHIDNIIDNNNCQLSIDEMVEEIKNLFRNHYKSISERFTTKKVKLQLQKKINDYDLIKKGLDNYLALKVKTNTSIKYIKSIDLFIRDEMYKEYQIIDFDSSEYKNSNANYNKSYADEVAERLKVKW